MWRHFPTVPDGRPALPPDQPIELPPVASEPGSSSAPSLRTLPDLVGGSASDGRRAAHQAGLRVELVDRPSSSGLWGRILEQEPPAGALTADAEVLVLTVGARPHVTVPDVRGRDEAEALSMLREAGLGTARRAVRRSDRMPEGYVVRTRPRAGAEVPSGSRISYVVAGPARVVDRGRRGSRRHQRAARMADGSFLIRGPE